MSRGLPCPASASPLTRAWSNLAKLAPKLHLANSPARSLLSLPRLAGSAAQRQRKPLRRIGRREKKKENQQGDI